MGAGESIPKTEIRPNIFEYSNYRVYLQNVYSSLKAQNKKFSYRFFSKAAGLHSPSFLKHVIDGERNLTPPMIKKFARALKLNAEESFFFKNLVFLNQAKTAEDKQIYVEQLLKSQMYKKIHPLSESHYKYYTHWYFVAVRELAGLEGCKDDPEWIAKTINPAISVNEARLAVDELLKMDLLLRNSNGHLIQSNPVIATADEVTNSAAAQYHREMMKKAAESIDRTPRELRDISSVIVGMSQKSVGRFKELIQKFRREILEVSAQEVKTKDVVYQFNLQLFPITCSLTEDEKELE